MRITTKGRYALRAMANLAMDRSAKPKSIKTIASEEEISPEFLEQIFFKLKKAGIINSVRGPGGGFSLHTSADQISVRSILIAVEEGLDLTPCTTCDTLGVAACPRIDICPSHQLWQDASDQLNGFFENAKLSSLVKP